MRIKNWSKMSSEELWKAWRNLHQSDSEAEARAVWAANRLVKTRPRATKLRFYEAKDAFIIRYQHCLIDGRQVRVETRKCRDCYGSGDDGNCDRCEGTGIYSQRTLYVHLFSIKGERYCFHSYEPPRRLSDVPGEDKEEYGGSFTAEEEKELLLPFSGLFKMLRWLCMARWPRTPTDIAVAPETAELPIPSQAVNLATRLPASRRICNCHLCTGYIRGASAG